MSDSSNSAERQSDGTAEREPEFKQEAERRLPCTPCSAWSSFWFVGAAHFGQMDAVAKEYRRTYDALPELSRPKALVVWGEDSTLVSDALMHYGLPTIRLTRMVGWRHYDSGEIPNVVREFHRFVEDFDDFVSTAVEPCWRDASCPDEMADSDKGKRIAGADLVEIKVVSFVPPGKAGDVGLKHEGDWGSLFSAERQMSTHGARKEGL